MKLQLSSLYWRRSKGLCRLSIQPTRCYPAKRITGILGLTRAFSSGLRWGVANQHDGQDFGSTCWSVLSSSPSAILSNISSSQTQKSSIPPDKIPLLAILLTPTHIELLDDRSDFVPELLRHTFELRNEGQDFDVLAAVVDRIPYPSLSRREGLTSYQTSLKDNVPDTQIEDGSEGISFAVLVSNSAAPDLWSARAEVVKLETMTMQQRCTLSFDFPPTSVPIPVYNDAKESTQPLVSRVLQLPVANTLFQNGKTSTLIAQRWSSQGSSQSSFTFSRSREVKLPQQTLDMTDLFSDQSVELKSSIHSNLMPITPTRVITAAVGNIIRRISVDDPSGDGVPASEELEKAISTAIKDGQIPAEQAGVWALVRPPNHPFSDPCDIDLEGTSDNEIQKAVLSGCRLHRVLSGGGGWGEKQGLLALDPDSDYRTDQQSFGSEDLDDRDLESEKLQAFEELVKPGDTVKFFVYRSPSISQSMSEPISKYGSTRSLTPLSIRFGSLPSNVDAMPNAPTMGTKFSSQSTCLVLKRHFGMLSEQGMSLQSTFMETDLRASKVRYLVPKLLKRRLPPFGVLNEFISTTKLDAPYMTWSVEEETGAVSLSTGVDRRKPQNSSGDAPNGTPQKHKNLGSKTSMSRRIHPLGANLETLGDFREAMITMPSHRHVSTAGPYPKDGRRAKGNVVEPKGRTVRKLIRKHNTMGFETGAASVPLAQFSQVQSRIHASQQPPADRSNGEPEGTGQLPPKIRLKAGLRIWKHGAKSPSVMNRRLPGSVRRALILEPLLSDENDEVVKASLGENSSRDSARLRLLRGRTAGDEQQSAGQIEPQTETETPAFAPLPKDPPHRMPASQSKIGTKSQEQHEGPEARSDIDAAIIQQITRQEQPSWRSGRVIRKYSVEEKPNPLVRKHLCLVSQGEHHIDQKALHDLKTAARGKEGLFRKKPQRMLIPKEAPIQMDPTWNNSPAYQKLQGLQIRKQLSHEPPSMGARGKAMKIHREYSLPLLNEPSGETPRP